MHRQFQEIIIDKKHRELAAEHAYKRTREIVRQFVPRNAPLSEVESNFTGVLGEIAVRKYLGLNTILEDNYHKHQIDDGDIEYEGLVYDVKTDAVVNSSYKKIYWGIHICPVNIYLCRYAITGTSNRV